MRIIKINNCLECPWVNGWGCCIEPSLYTELVTPDEGIPDWCPLDEMPGAKRLKPETRLFTSGDATDNKWLYPPVKSFVI